MRKIINSGAIVCLLLVQSVAFSAKEAEIAPAIGQTGEIAVTDRFDKESLGENWTVGKGDWSITDGEVVGKEKSEDNHAAVLTLRHPHRNAIARFSFKLDGAKGFNVSFNHKRQHLFRVGIDENGLRIVKDKVKRQPGSKPVVLARTEGTFAPGEWHTVSIETLNDQVVVQVDNGVKLEARDSDLDKDKTGYRFVTRGESLLLDDLTVWQVKQ